MKDNNNEMIVMSKRFDQMSVEKKSLENKLGECEKNVRRLETGLVNINEKLNGEISKVYEVIKETDSRVGLKFFEEKQ